MLIWSSSETNREDLRRCPQLLRIWCLHQISWDHLEMSSQLSSISMMNPKPDIYTYLHSSTCRAEHRSGNSRACRQDTWVEQAWIPPTIYTCIWEDQSPCFGRRPTVRIFLFSIVRYVWLEREDIVKIPAQTVDQNSNICLGTDQHDWPVYLRHRCLRKHKLQCFNILSLKLGCWQWQWCQRIRHYC